MINKVFHLINATNGFLFKKLPQDIYLEIREVVNKVQINFSNATPINNTLAGQIDKEYQTNLTAKSTQYIKSCVEEYNNVHPSYLSHLECQFKSPQLLFNYDGDCWINFQKKYEYNPLHHHTGIFSYVIWYQIPYYKEDEIKYGAGKGKRPENNKNGEFEFIYHNGECVINHPLGIDKKREGYISLFPSSLDHIVYPFYTSDDYRITISGNIYLK